MNNEIKMRTCCFTGHRPKNIKYSEEKIKPLLKKAIGKAIDNGYINFITEMAPGVDTWAAEIVLEYKKSNNGIHLLCAIPHAGFEKCRTLREEAEYNLITLYADRTAVLSPKYFKGCYMERNKFMVERSSLVIAVFNGRPSGTKNTIDYAMSQNIKIVNILKNNE